MFNSSIRLILRLFFLTGLVLSYSVLFAQNIGFYFENDQSKISFPIEIYNNLIVVPLTINDEYQLKFILDTGVRNTILIDKKFADSLGMAYQRKMQLVGAGDSKPVDAFVTGPVSLSLPGIKSTGISTLVLEEDFLQLEHHLGIKIHGLIGYDIFSRFVVKIDYFHEKITFFDPGTHKVKNRYHVIDLEITESKPIAKLNLQLNKQQAIQGKLLIDTGASHALVLHQNSSEEISLPEKYIETILGRGLSGEIRGYLGRIEGMDFGKEKLSGVITSYPNESDFGIPKEMNRNGSIGGELLKKFSVIFDFLNSKMYVKSNRYFKYPFEYNMSGLEFTAEGEGLNRYVIGNIRAASAASDVGFEVGDIVVSLNNMPAARLNLTKIYSQLNLREGKKINLTVFRNGKYISRSFRLKREI